MNRQRQIIVTVTYNDLGIIVDAKAEPYEEPNLQQTCNQLATDCISRRAAIDVLTSEPPEMNYGFYYAEKIKALPYAQPERKWIPCSERTPEDVSKDYWVCTDTGYQCECRWTNINHFWTNLTMDWHWHIMDIPQYSHVVAWRELPEPYKEEKEDNANG